MGIDGSRTDGAGFDAMASDAQRDVTATPPHLIAASAAELSAAAPARAPFGFAAPLTRPLGNESAAEQPSLVSGAMPSPDEMQAPENPGRPLDELAPAPLAQRDPLEPFFEIAEEEESHAFDPLAPMSEPDVAKDLDELPPPTGAPVIPATSQFAPVPQYPASPTYPANPAYPANPYATGRYTAPQAWPPQGPRPNFPPPGYPQRQGQGYPTRPVPPPPAHPRPVPPPSGNWPPPANPQQPGQGSPRPGGR